MSKRTVYNGCMDDLKYPELTFAIFFFLSVGMASAVGHMMPPLSPDAMQAAAAMFSF